MIEATTTAGPRLPTALVLNPSDDNLALLDLRQIARKKAPKRSRERVDPAPVGIANS